ncbi:MULTISPECIES: hypothetical protein [Lysobacter]|uniref:hypothetical protein n=1 Tax=Lysobacter TaxID=68 RepID=UPI001F38168F|nr:MULTISPECIES: hypothetical protein [Lysobacter]UJB18258.1 hypothetical protein L1A79_18210 [Lysobacter capsici]UJQ28019.1 hypothetical protein L2D09_21675 [Lysobacter gummosus]
MNSRRPTAFLTALSMAAVLLLLGGCARMSCRLLEPPTAETAATDARAVELFKQLNPLCGKAFAGRVVVNTPASADDPFAGQPLIMHVRRCDEPGVIRIPFQVGNDRSRTWVFRRFGGGMHFSHDHRHRDGSEDELSWYGGDLRMGDKASRYEFPADDYSQAMFRKLGREVSVPNVWAVEIDAQRFVYELSRPGRLFRVEFDLTHPVPAPPPPWGG